MDVYVTLTFRTLIPFEGEIDIAEITEADAFAQLLTATNEDITDNWTLVGVDASFSPPPAQEQDR